MASPVVKPQGSLKDYLDSTKRSSRLLGAVEKHLAKREEPPRSTVVLHPSEIIKDDWCHRASWFALRGFDVPKTKPHLRLQNIFDEGHLIHHKWQQRFREMGTLYGAWKCLSCKDVVWDTSPAGCQECGSTFLEYGEVTLQSDPRLRITGHADGWVKGIGGDTLIEIKSIGFGTIRMESPRLAAQVDGDFDAAWQRIRTPFKSHRLQGLLYLELGWQMAQLGFFSDFPDEIVFLYENKANQDYKEFVVQRDPDAVKPIMRHARNIVKAIDGGLSVPCNLDMQSGCAKCRVFKEDGQ